MKVVIDTSTCTGHGRCYTLSPDVFESDDSGYGQVMLDGDGEVPPALEQQARAAVANCPERAITVVE
ncbi:MAG TPA: ferredoxin [Acidimicrobiales bacterium]